MKYIIWRSPDREINLLAFNKLNNLRDLDLTPILLNWALKFSLNYPNSVGTQVYASPIICKNPDSEYYNAVAMSLPDALWESLTPEIINELSQVGIITPDKGIAHPITELPSDWDSLPVIP